MTLGIDHGPIRKLAILLLVLAPVIASGCRESSDDDSNLQGGRDWGSLSGLSFNPNLSAATLSSLAGDMQAQKYLVSTLDQWIGAEAGANLRGGNPYRPQDHSVLYNKFFKELVRSWQDALPVATDWNIPELGIRAIVWNPKVSDEAFVIATSGKAYLCKVANCRAITVNGVQNAAYRNENEIILVTAGGLTSLKPDHLENNDTVTPFSVASDVVDLKIVAGGKYLVTSSAGASLRVTDLDDYTDSFEHKLSYQVQGVEWDARYPDWILVTTTHRIEVIHLVDKSILQSYQQIPFDSKFTEARFFPSDEVEAIVTMARGGSHAKLESWDFSGDRLHMRIVDNDSELIYKPRAQSIFLHQPQGKRIERLYGSDLRSSRTIKLRVTDEVFSVSGLERKPSLISAGTFMPVRIKDIDTDLIKSESLGGVFHALGQGNPKAIVLNSFDDTMALSVHKSSIMIWSQNLEKRSVYTFPSPIDGTIVRHPMNPHVLLFKSLPNDRGYTKLHVLNFLATAQYFVDINASKTGL